MNKAYAVFSVFGDGDSYSRFGLEGLSFSLAGAKKMIANLEDKVGYSSKILDATHNPLSSVQRLVHKNMNKSNNYTYVGTREDVNSMHNYGDFGGYVVEEMIVVD